MNTITIDSTVYKNAENYAKKHNLNIAHIVEEYFKKLISDDTVDSVTEPTEDYYISPKIKSLIVGFRCDENMTYEYKQDMKRAKAEKYV